MIKPRKIQQQKLTLISAVRAVTPDDVKAVVQAGCWWQEAFYVVGKKRKEGNIRKIKKITI